MKKKVLIQAWNVYRNQDNYYIEYTQAVYIETLLNKGRELHLISPVHNISSAEIHNYSEIPCNVIIYSIPPYTRYISAYKYFPSYVMTYYKLRKKRFDTIYSRFPSPFGWLQMLFYTENRIVHFVGDPIDTVLKNNELNPIFKFVKIFFFLPEYALFLISSLRANYVYSNGHHIATKLNRIGIKAIPVISSTLVNEDFYEKNTSLIEQSSIKLIYVGYLRKAKGVSILLKAIKYLDSKYPDKFTLTIVGTGELENSLKEFVTQKQLPVIFLGHIDNRSELNKVLRQHDIFCFASLSEGSPRVILEAMANGLIVSSTPVGSLPYIFEDYEDILFFGFDDFKALAGRILEISNNSGLGEKLRGNSIKKVRLFTIDNFIEKVFNIDK